MQMIAKAERGSGGSWLMLVSERPKIPPFLLWKVSIKLPAIIS